MAPENDRHADDYSSPSIPWTHILHEQPESHHGTPVTENYGFRFNMQSGTSSDTIQPHTLAKPLQPLVMPQWPSMLISPPHAKFRPALATPSILTSSTTKSKSKPRKKLTDLDKKNMCQYAEENPKKTRTEIGAIFGVDRSTVSRILRQKEKNLSQDGGSKSSVKHANGRSLGLERSLAMWAKNLEKKGMQLSDEIIYDQAQTLACTDKTPNEKRDMRWIQKLKLKHNLMGARSRKSSDASADAEGISALCSPSHSPNNGTSPIPPPGVELPELGRAQSQGSLAGASRRGPWHAQSTTSFNSAFSNTAPPSFSASLSNTTSPILTSDSGTAPGVFVVPSGPISTEYSSTLSRPRNHTSPQPEPGLPMYAMDERIVNSPQLLGDTPPEENPHTISTANTIQHLPLPVHMFYKESWRNTDSAASCSLAERPTSSDEARRALQVVMRFIEQQPRDFLDFQEIIHMGQLTEKLKSPQICSMTTNVDLSEEEVR